MAIPVLALIVMAGTWTALIALIRAPMGTPSPLATFEVFLLTGAVMLAWREGARRVLDQRWPSYAIALLFTLSVLFSPAVVWMAGGAATVVVPLMLVAVWVAGLPPLMRDCRRAAMWQGAAAILIGAALGFTYFLYVNTRGYGTVFSPEQTLLGTQHRDTLFHASIAGMLGQFGVPATGLDGLVRVRYYFLSHALIGVTGRWIGVPPIHAYYLINQLLILPLLLFSVTAATFWLWRPRQAEPAGLTTLLVPLLLLVIFERWDWASYLLSESFAVSLVLMLLAVPLVMEIAQRPVEGRPGLAPVQYATLALCSVAIVMAKSSVGLLFAGGVLFITVRAGLRAGSVAVAAAIAAVVIGLAVAVTAIPSYGGDPLIGPLHFFRAYPDAAYPNLWAILFGLGLGMWAWISAERPMRTHLEFLGAIGLAALGCGLVFQIGAGAAYYFMNVGVWMAIVLAGGAFLLPRLQRWGHHASVAVGLAAAVAVAVVATPDKRRAASNFVRLAVAIDGEATAQSGQLPDHALAGTETIMTFLSPYDPIRRHIAQAVRETPGGRMGSRLLAEARDTDVVFVPPTNSVYWHISKVCTTPPFFVPALAARPLIHGLPPSRQECPLPPDTGNGYGDYEENSRSIVMSDSELCQDVRRDGFTTALVLESPDASRILSCR